MTQPPEPPEPPGERQTYGRPWVAFLTALLGIVMFVVVNALLFALPIDVWLRSGSNNHVGLIVAAVILLLVALAGTLLAVRATSYFVKGLGIGLVIGWALVSIVSGGYCTGLNPGLYSALPL